MTKSEAILLLEKKHANARTIVDEFLTIIEKSLAKQEPVYIRGLGTFKPIVKKAKKGQLIKNGRGKYQSLSVGTIDIPEQNSVKFILSKNLLK